MHPPIRNAIVDLKARLSRPLIWAFALGFPLICILLMVLFAPRQSAAHVWEASMCLLAFIPVLFLSPIPWQFRSDRRKLNGWFWALPAHLLFSAVLGPCLTALVILAILPSEGFRAFYLTYALEGTLTFWAITLPMGWMQAQATWLRERTEWARTQAKASVWMRHSSSFDPNLLTSHLRHLARTAEASPEATVEGILSLAELYRQWLVYSESTLVNLAEERRLLEMYIEAESYRTMGDLRVEWFWAPGRAAWKLPPYTLFYLAAAMVTSGARYLRFSAQIKHEGLALTIEGKMPPQFRESPVCQGVGVRLERAIGHGAALTVDPAAGVILLLPGMTQ